MRGTESGYRAGGGVIRHGIGDDRREAEIIDYDKAGTFELRAISMGGQMRAEMQ